MKKNYYSGDWYLTITDELPMSNNGELYCQFDLTKYKNSKWGCPIDRCGSIDKVLRVLKGYQEKDKDPKYECLKEINKEQIKMQNDFIEILSNYKNVI